MAALCRPDFVRLVRYEVEPFEMHVGFLNVPGADWLIDCFGQFFGQLKFEQSVHIPEGMNGIEFVAHDSYSLRKVHR